MRGRKTFYINIYYIQKSPMLRSLSNSIEKAGSTSSCSYDVGLPSVILSNKKLKQ